MNNQVEWHEEIADERITTLRGEGVSVICEVVLNGP